MSKRLSELTKLAREASRRADDAGRLARGILGLAEQFDRGAIELDVVLQIVEWMRKQEDQDGRVEDIAHGILRGDWRSSKVGE